MEMISRGQTSFYDPNLNVTGRPSCEWECACGSSECRFSPQKSTRKCQNVTTARNEYVWRYLYMVIVFPRVILFDDDDGSVCWMDGCDPHSRQKSGRNNGNILIFIALIQPMFFAPVR